jgi:Flp pilus assembly protein TadG
LVEFAIVMPVMLLMTLGLIDLGRAFVFGVAVQEGTRQAARLAASASDYTLPADLASLDKTILGRLIASSSPALSGCTPAAAPPQDCNSLHLEEQVKYGNATYASLYEARMAMTTHDWSAAIHSAGGIQVTVKAAGPVALLPGVSTGAFGLTLPNINVQGQSTMVVL